MLNIVLIFIPLENVPQILVGLLHMYVKLAIYFWPQMFQPLMMTSLRNLLVIATQYQCYTNPIHGLPHPLFVPDCTYIMVYICFSTLSMVDVILNYCHFINHYCVNCVYGMAFSSYTNTSII